MTSLAASGRLHSRHFDFLHYAIVLLNGSAKFHQTWYDGPIDPWNYDVINYFRSAAVTILKNFFCRNWTTGPRVTKFDTEVHHNTLVNFTENDGASYFRSSTIRHFDFFTLRCRSPKWLDRIASNLVGLLYISSDKCRPKMMSFTTSVRQPSLCCELRQADYFNHYAP
jgi:hypothetical protein